jgi:uncharacterized membrane protein YbhN (UPF0104 family)
MPGGAGRGRLGGVDTLRADDPVPGPAGGPVAGVGRGAARRLVRPVLSTVLLVAILAGAVPQLRGFGDAWPLVRGLGPAELGALAVAAAWNIVSYFPAAVAALPGLTLRRAGAVNQAATAVASTVPGGDAISVGLMVAMYRSYGFAPGPIALAVLAGGICSSIAKLVVPLPAVLALLARGESTAHLAPAALAGAVAALAGALAVAMAVRPSLAVAGGDAAGRLASGLARAVGRPPVSGWGAAMAAFRADAVVLARGRGRWMVAFAVVSHLSLFAVLLVALRVVGVSSADVSGVEAFGAFAFVHLVTLLPLPAGGLGVLELGLTTSLVAAGADGSAALAATLLFRAVTFLPPLPIGALAYLLWRRTAPAPA